MTLSVNDQGRIASNAAVVAVPSPKVLGNNFVAVNGCDDYAWGKVGDTRGHVWWGCMNTGDVLSAVQVGDKLTLNGYDRGNVQVCGTTMTLQP